MLAIENYSGAFVARLALQFMALTFCRPVEIVHAEWREFAIQDKLWRIPASKMKMARDHLVPLSPQAVAVLEAIRPYSGAGEYVFPGLRRGKAPSRRPQSVPAGESSSLAGIESNAVMRIQALVAALRRMGFAKDETCAHGFRAMASTLLNEQGFPPDVIERQLVHVPSNQVRAAYNRAEYLPERRRMMDDWANYLDKLRQQAVAVPFPA